MSLIHSASCPAVKSETNLFEVPATQAAIKEVTEIEYYPTAAVQSNLCPNVSFEIPGSVGSFIDPNSIELSLTINVTGFKGTAATALAADDTAVYCGVNNLLYSMISQADLMISEKIVTTTTNNHPYGAYLETLLGASTEAKLGILKSVGWFNMKDGESFDTPTAERQLMLPNGKDTTLRGPVNVHINKQERLILDGLRLRYNFQFHHPSFYMIVKPGYGVTVSIKKAVLIVRHVTLYAGMQLALAAALMKTEAKYFIKRDEVKSFTIAQGSMFASVDNAINGQFPVRIMIGTVKNENYNGKEDTSPLNFEHCDATEITIHARGRTYPSLRLQPDYENDNYQNEYVCFYKELNQQIPTTSMSLTYKQYKNGFTFYCANLQPDFSDGCAQHFSLIERGPVRIEMRFKKALPKAMTVLVFSTYDNVIYIDKDRNCRTDYN